MSAIDSPERHFGRPAPFSAANQPARKPGMTRNQLAQRMIADVGVLWTEQGEALLRRAAFHDPTKTVQLCLGLLPQRIEHVADTAGMTDERYAELLNAVHAAIEAKRSQGAPPPLRLDGDAAETGGGGPPAVALRGEVEGPIRPIATQPERQLERRAETADPRATPVQATVETTYSLISEEDEVDPASLF